MKLINRLTVQVTKINILNCILLMNTLNKPSKGYSFAALPW